MAEESIVLRRLGCALRSEAVAWQSQESSAAAMEREDLLRHRIAQGGEAVAWESSERMAKAMVCKDLLRRWNALIC